MNLYLILLTFLSLYNFTSSTTSIKIYNINRCNSKTYYPVTVKNVSIKIKNGYAQVTGSLTTDIDINSPVRASLVAKRYIDYVDIWTLIPCVHKLGSCTYEDLCYWGKSPNETCPDIFLKNNVPCRCPILKGTYEMKAGLFEIVPEINVGGFLTPATGTYFIHATISTSKNQLLSCYEFYLDYSDVSLKYYSNYSMTNNNNELDSNAV